MARIVLPLAAGLLPLAVYLFYLAPTIVGGDTGELATCAATLGVAHPPGYPTFTMLGHAFTWIPFGSVAWRVNLMSAVLSAGAAALVFLTLRRIGTGPFAALAGAWGLAFSRFFWHYAEVAEVFPLNSFLVSAILLVLFHWRALAIEAGGRAAATVPARRWLMLLGFLCGLALTNHHTSVLVFPAVLYLVFAVDPRVFTDARLLLSVLGCFLAGLLPYAYLPLAASARPVMNWDDPVTLDGFLASVLRRDYGSLSLLSTELKYEAPSRLLQLSELGRGLLQAFTVVGLALIAAGMAAFRRRRDVTVFLWIAFALAGPGFVLLANMPFQDKPLLLGVLHRFYILPSVLLAVWIGLGAEAVADFVGTRSRQGRPGREGGTPFAPALPFLLAGTLLAWNHGEADFRDNRLARDLGINALSFLPPHSLLFVRGDALSMAVDHAQQVEGFRTDVHVLDQEKMTYEWFYREAAERFPDVVLPGVRYDGRDVKNVDLIDRNLPNHPDLYFSDFKETSYLARYRSYPIGTAVRIEPLAAPERPVDEILALNRAACDGFDMTGVDGEYPPTTFESQMRLQYVYCPFYDGMAAERRGDFPAAAEAYRKATVYNPTYPPPYLNLAVALTKVSPVPASEVVSLLKKFLTMSPADPQADAIRQMIQAYGG